MHFSEIFITHPSIYEPIYLNFHNYIQLYIDSFASALIRAILISCLFQAVIGSTTPWFNVRPSHSLLLAAFSALQPQKGLFYHINASLDEFKSFCRHYDKTPK